MNLNDIITWFNGTVTLFNGTFHFGFFADVLSVVGSVFAFFAWTQAKINSKQMTKEKERMNSKIKIILRENVSKRQIVLPVHLRRLELTRTELLGRMGMIPMKNKNNRFALSYLHTASFFEELNRIQSSNQEEDLVIPCSSEEIEQFDV
jgi:hypothetical protein